MEILITKNVGEGKPIILLHKKKGAWIALSAMDLETGIRYNEEELTVVDRDYIRRRIPILEHLNYPDNTTVNIDYETGEVNINKKHFHFGIPTHKAKAARQSNSDFNFIFYLKYHFNEYKSGIKWFLIFLFLGFILHWGFFIIAFIILIINLLIVTKARDMYFSGALCPAVVIDEKLSLIAAYTNMTIGVGKYPIIHIRKKGLPKEREFWISMNQMRTISASFNC